MAKGIQCPAECGSRFVSEEFLKRHLAVEHPTWKNVPRQKGWCTPYGFGDWTHPITYEEACERMKEITQKFSPSKGTQP